MASPSPRRASMADVAAAAGVSSQTVSRVVNETAPPANFKKSIPRAMTPPDRALEITVGEQVSAGAWKAVLAMARVFVRWVEDEEGFSVGFDACNAELLRHVTVVAERVRRLAV